MIQSCKIKGRMWWQIFFVVVFVFILIFIFQTSCTVKDDCQNRFDFVSCDDSIPVLDLDISKHPDLIRQEMTQLYGYDLCQECSLVDFRIPFLIEGQKGSLKVMADFDSPVCGDCPLWMRLRHSYFIMMNQNDQLLVEGEVVDIDSLHVKIENYLGTIGNDEMAPKTLKKLVFILLWDQETSKGFLNSVLAILYKSHLAYVEKELKKNGYDLCRLNKSEIMRLKELYPLRIEFDLGKIRKMAPMDLKKQTKE